MNYAKWTTLKTANKAGFKKEGDINFLEVKRYDSDTGAELTASKESITLAELERDKANLTAKKAKLTTEIAEIGKMITQIKKV